MFRALRWIGSSLVSLAMLYAFFFVPLGGTRTLWDHTRRILGTPEAHELGEDIRSAGDRVATKIRREVVPAVLPGYDAGLRADAAATRKSR